jgi:endoglucanase
MQEATLEQYTLLGDQADDTDGLRYNASMKPEERSGTESGKPDDRWVFTEQDPEHEYKAISALAACGRVLKTYKPAVAAECTQAAEHLWAAETDPPDSPVAIKAFNERMIAASQLWMTTRAPSYKTVLLENRATIMAHANAIGWMVAQVAPSLGDAAFLADLHGAVGRDFAAMAKVQQADSPFGVPYKPHIWGAGWEIERFGVEQYYLHRAFPDIVSADYMLNALNFMLGVHPGENTASFASGVGARSTTIAYGFNRADSSYIPGGVVSGTALIRPDFPELKDFPFLWQQMEYVLGGGSTNYMFLVLAADQVLNAK